MVAAHMILEGDAVHEAAGDVFQQESVSDVAKSQFSHMRTGLKHHGMGILRQFRSL